MSVRGPYSDRSPTRRGRSRQLLAGQAVSNAKRPPHPPIAVRSDNVRLYTRFEVLLTMLVHRLAEKTGESFASNGLRRIAAGYTAAIGPR